MKPTEIKDLVTGLLVIVMAAIAFGQFGKLEHFARVEAGKALRPHATLPFFNRSL
jgi:hypothetical protein